MSSIIYVVLILQDASYYFTKNVYLLKIYTKYCSVSLSTIMCPKFPLIIPINLIKAFIQRYGFGDVKPLIHMLYNPLDGEEGVKADSEKASIWIYHRLESNPLIYSFLMIL